VVAVMVVVTTNQEVMVQIQYSQQSHLLAVVLVVTLLVIDMVMTEVQEVEAEAVTLLALLIL
jgi:ribosomal protein L18